MRSISKPGLFDLTHEQAFTEGTALHTAIRYNPEETRLAIIKAVADTVKFIDAKKTLNGTDDIILTAEAILRNNPTTTLEELRMVCDGMKTGKFGKYYERLKTQEFLDCLNRHEADRAEILERRANEHKITRGATDPTRSNFVPQSMADLRRKQAAPLFEAAKRIADAERERNTNPTNNENP